MKIRYRELLLLPNLITLFRLFLAIPICYILLNYKEINNFNYILVTFILLAFISDLSDGYVARRTQQITELGKLLDPLADKLLTFMLALFFWVADYVALEYLILLIFRDIAIFVGGVYISSITGTILASNYVGKATILSIGVYFLSLLLSSSMNIHLILMYFSVVMSIISLLVYFFRGIKIIKSHGNL